MTILNQTGRPSGTGFRAYVRAHYEVGLFGLLLLLHLLPIWAFRHFPTADGPAHVYNAWLLKLLLLEPRHDFHQYLAFNPVPVPNYLASALLAGAMQLLPSWLAEKVVQTLFVAGLPLAGRYMVRAWQPRAGFLALLAFPLVYSAVFQYGFYNFCLSLVLLLVVLGYWRRHFYAQRPGWRYRVGLGALFVVLYFAHPLTYLLAGLILGLFILEAAWIGRYSAAAGAGGGGTLKADLQALLLVCFPSLVLLGWYLQRPATEAAVAAAPPGPGRLLLDWLALEPLRFMGSAEGTYRTLLAVVLLSLAGYATWQLWPRRKQGGVAWLLAIVLLVLGYVVLPDALVGGSIIRPRLGLLSYLLIPGLLSTARYSRRLRQAVVSTVVLLSVLLLVFRFGKYRTLVTGLEEYRSAASYIRPGSSIVSFTCGNVSRMPNGKEYKSYIDVFPHAASYLSVERELLNLENYEAHTGYFPLVWQPGRSFLAARDSTPARARWAAYPASQWPAYVVLWGRAQALPPSARSRELAARLARSYRLIFTSKTGLLELYTRNAGAAGSGNRVEGRP